MPVYSFLIVLTILWFSWAICAIVRCKSIITTHEVSEHNSGDEDASYLSYFVLNCTYLKMAPVGKFAEFDSTKEDFTNYCERLQQYFVANGVEDDKQVATFLSLIGPSTYGLLKSLLIPDLPSTKTFVVLVKTLKDHLAPKPLIIGERFKFYTHNQREGESISCYSAELKKLATHCEFGAFLIEALRDRLVCGLRADYIAIQDKLLTTADLTFTSAIDISVGMEQAKDFRHADGSVHSIHSARSGRGRGRGRHLQMPPQNNNSYSNFKTRPNLAKSERAEKWS